MNKSNCIKVAFWNVGNLFDIKENEIATDSEFSPERGWTKDVRDKKLENLTKVIKSMNFSTNTNEPDFEPDLLGLCEVEDKGVLQELIDKMNPEKYEIARYQDSPDFRGIDTCLIYSKKMFECLDTSSYGIDLRYPTRDIFHAFLRIRENNSNLHVLVNHWPSRRGKYVRSQPKDTDHARITAAEKCGKILDTLLKIPKEEVYLLPNLFDKDHLARLDYDWNKNILLMGDFNDEPYNESITKHLNTVSDIRSCREWKEIIEIRARDEKNALDVSHRKYYLEECACLFNCMWKLVADPNSIGNVNLNLNVPGGSIYYWATNRWSLFDQFMISRGLYYGKQKLKFRIDSVKIFYKGLRLVDNLSYDKFSDSKNGNYSIDKSTVHQSSKGSPMDFVYMKRTYNESTKQLEDDNKSVPAWREKNTGYSDHFPILCIIDILNQ